jgi:hypothetical protein
MNMGLEIFLGKFGYLNDEINLSKRFIKVARQAIQSHLL